MEYFIVSLSIDKWISDRLMPNNKRRIKRMKKNFRLDQFEELAIKFIRLWILLAEEWQLKK